ncbi:MAG: sensor histidine kinase [Cyanobacteriota bacterium]|jgi:two-component system NarL family sensor kinase
MIGEPSRVEDRTSQIYKSICLENIKFILLFLVVFILEISTPVSYVFGYLYIAPILWANRRLENLATWKLTFIAIFLTLLNLIFPHKIPVETSTVINRCIASLSLGVTGIICEQNRRSQKILIQQESQLQSQEKLVKLREDFASTLTHDLKTPLLGALETLKAFEMSQFGPVNKRQKQVLNTMSRSHQSSLYLVETLLDVYRNDIEGLSLNLAPVNLTSLAEEASNALANLAASHQVYIRLNYGDSDFRQALWVLGDKLQLERVLSNLLINAINHSLRGDHVEVCLTAQTLAHTVKILDTGSGINPDEFANLFERFYQGGSNRQAKGTGLGLYLCRQIIDAHCGKIWAENRSSKGAMFAFQLPRYHP